MWSWRAWRRRRLRGRPFPAEWRRILEEGLPYYRCLSPGDKEELHGHIQVFLAEKYFEGAGGLKITDEMRVSIAAQACILLLHRDTGYYPRLKTIIVYPGGYVATGRSIGPGPLVTESTGPRLGESWHHPLQGGPVVLSWRDVRRGAADVRDGENIVFHEFAHQLDAESGSVEGAPALPRRSMYIAWARVLGEEYKSLVEDLRRGRATLLRPYAATNPAEFFAVVTELFFERPGDLRGRHPELYEQMRTFYRQDPAAVEERLCAARAEPEPRSCGAVQGAG